MDPLKTERSNQLLPVIVILVIAVGIVASGWFVASSALHNTETAGQLDAAAFAAVLGKEPTTDEGCIRCHGDRTALTADLEENPVQEAEKSTESEGEG